MLLIIAFVIGIISSLTMDYLKRTFRDHWKAYFVYKICPKCEHCHTIFGLALEESRTMYPVKDDCPEKDNPNRSQLLCRRCAEYHHEYWDDMWKDYYSGRL